MARQRSGSSSSRNSRGPRGARPASTRPAAKAPPAAAAQPEVVADPPAVDPVDDTAVDDTTVDDTAVEETAAELPATLRKKPARPEPPADDPVDVPDDASDDVDPVEAEVEAELDEDDELVDDEELERIAAAAELWSEVRIAPVEIALPKGVGYTLRAYRMSDELAAVEIEEREDEFEGFLNRPSDEDDDELAPEEELAAALGLEAGPATRSRGKDREDDLDFDDDEDDDLDPEALEDDDEDDDLDPEALDDDDLDPEALDDDEDDDEPAAADESADSDDDDDDEDDDDVEVKAAPEEVPVFLGRRGKVYVFASPERLVEFVNASDDHDLAQLDTWADLRGRISADDIAPDPADKYELDLVVDNLRGGADSLDYGLLIQAGELARDIAFATRLEPVISALGPGTTLDDLDEAVRAADERGGLRGFMAKRKLRKIVTQQTALGWRTIIGKISSVVDWRE